MSNLSLSIWKLIYCSIESFSKRSSLKLWEFVANRFWFFVVKLAWREWSDRTVRNLREEGRKERCWRIRWPLCCRGTSGITWGDSTKRLLRSVFGKVCSVSHSFVNSKILLWWKWKWSFVDCFWIRKKKLNWIEITFIRCVWNVSLYVWSEFVKIGKGFL